METFHSILSELNNRLNILQRGRTDSTTHDTTLFDRFSELLTDFNGAPTKEKLTSLKKSLGMVQRLLDLPVDNFIVTDCSADGTEQWADSHDWKGKKYSEMILEELKVYKLEIENILSLQTGKIVKIKTDKFGIALSSIELGVLLGGLFSTKLLDGNSRIKTKLVSFLCHHFYSTIDDTSFDPDTVYNRITNPRSTEKDRVIRLFEKFSEAISKISPSDITSNEKLKKRKAKFNR
jgi:hypothetical protein